MSADTLKHTPVIKMKEMTRTLEPYKATGVVLWFKALKGYGFILETLHGRKVFVHHANIEGQGDFRFLEPGDIVKCSVELTPKGWAAMKVLRTGSSEDRYVESKRS